MSDLKLSDVLARRVGVEWHEGVAIVRAVSARLLSANTQLRAVPELHQVVLLPTGELNVTGTSAGEDPVRRLGQFLQAMLSTSEPPVQLRLVVSQATAPTPGFSSIEDFDSALGYYERPNREGILQALYERAIAAPPPADVQPPPRLDVIAPLPERRPAPSRERKRRQPIKKGPFVAAAVLLLIAFGSFYYLKTSGIFVSGSDASALASKASESVGAAVVSGLSAVTERVGLGRLVDASAPASPAPTVPANVTDLKPAVVRRPGKSTLMAFDLDPKFTTGLPVIAAAAVPAETPDAAEVDDGDAPEPVGDSTIYSAASAEVTPPVGKRMLLPKNLPTGINPGDLGSVELIIGADGLVESVRLLGAPRNVLDSLWLSALKAWEFEPAMKNGIPVRYRKTVWIATQ